MNPEVYAHRHDFDDGHYCWPCPYCPFEAFGPDIRRLSLHVGAVHPSLRHHWDTEGRVQAKRWEAGES